CEQAYERAARFEDRRGFTLLQPTPFQNHDDLAVTKAFAAKYHLSTLEQLKGLGPLKYGGYQPLQTRYEGLVGLQQAYGLGNLQFVPMTPGSPVYAAVDGGRSRWRGALRPARHRGAGKTGG